MDLYKEYGFDDDLATAGVWVKVKAGEDSEIKVAYVPNKAYDKFLELPRRRAREAGQEIPAAVIEEAWARFVLLDWRNVEYKGQAIEATEANRLSMLRQYPGFFARVQQIAFDNKNFQRAHDEAEEKNSVTGLNGSSALVQSLST
jgi:hypothetical protein